MRRGCETASKMLLRKQMYSAYTNKKTIGITRSDICLSLNPEL